MNTTITMQRESHKKVKCSCGYKVKDSASLKNEK